MVSISSPSAKSQIVLHYHYYYFIVYLLTLIKELVLLANVYNHLSLSFTPQELAVWTDVMSSVSLLAPQGKLSFSNKF